MITPRRSFIIHQLRVSSTNVTQSRDASEEARIPDFNMWFFSCSGRVWHVAILTKQDQSKPVEAQQIDGLLAQDEGHFRAIEN